VTFAELSLFRRQIDVDSSLMNGPSLDEAWLPEAEENGPFIDHVIMGII
jgi:hypothetical protein